MLALDNALLHTLRAADDRSAAATIDELGRQCNPATVPALLEVLRWRQLSTIQDDARTALLAWRAIVALGRIGEPTAVTFLVAAVCEESSLLRGAVAAALGQIATKSKEPAIRDLIVLHLQSMLSDRGIISCYWQWHVGDEAKKQIEQIGTV